MKFSTPVNISKSKFFIVHEDPLVLMGSCFSQNIGQLLKQHKFNVAPNSFGIVYNPISIANNLTRLLNQKLYTAKDIYTFKQQKLINFNNQSSSFNIDNEHFLTQQNEVLNSQIEAFNKSKTLIITLGTAWVYVFNETQEIVANCHKIPNTNFSKRLLSVEEIVACFQPILTQLKHLNIIFTVSPVRHVKGGLHENNLSKSTLHIAINKLTEQFENCNYFPAYEIVIDELRDYRFYKEDFVHPSDLAIQYVWEKFSDAYFDENTQLLNKALIKVIQSANHRPFNPESEAHQKFTKVLFETINNIQKDFPFLDFEKEKEQLN